MTKERGKRKAPSPWLKQQAASERKAREARAARQTEAQAKDQQARQILSNLVKQTVEQQTRLQRLSTAFADRCWRVHELMGLLRREWERAETAEARVKELEAQLAAKPNTNGHAKKAVPRKATAKETK